MCLACLELGKPTLSTPRELARAYAETYNSVPAEHDTIVLEKLLKALENSTLTHEEQLQYVLDTNNEMQSLIDLMGAPTGGSAN